MFLYISHDDVWLWLLVIMSPRDWICFLVIPYMVMSASASMTNSELRDEIKATGKVRVWLKCLLIFIILKCMLSIKLKYATNLNMDYINTQTSAILIIQTSYILLLYTLYIAWMYNNTIKILKCLSMWDIGPSSVWLIGMIRLLKFTIRILVDQSL